MAFDTVFQGLTGREQVDYIKEYCKKRVSKYGLTTIKGGACKSCIYRYRGTNPLYCCAFGNLPKDWSETSIVEVYGDK